MAVCVGLPNKKGNLSPRYMNHEGLKVSGHSCIASTFSWQIANGNACSTPALESMGRKPSFCCYVLNIAPIYKQYARKEKQVLFTPQNRQKANSCYIFLLRPTNTTAGLENPFSSIGTNALIGQTLPIFHSTRSKSGVNFRGPHNPYTTSSDHTFQRVHLRELKPML